MISVADSGLDRVDEQRKFKQIQQCTFERRNDK